MGEVNEDVKTDIEELDSLNAEEELDLEELTLKGMNIACSLFIIVMCYVISFLFSKKALFIYGAKLHLINSCIIMPLMFVFLTINYKKIGASNLDILKSIIKKILLYLLFSVVSILFWMTAFNLQSFKFISIFMVITIYLMVIMVHIGSIASILVLLLYNLEKNKKTSMVDEKVVLNVDIIKVAPIVFVFALQLFVIVNTFTGLIMGNMDMVESCARLLSIGLTRGISLIIALQGLIAGLFGINLKKVYKYVLLSMLLGLFWAYMMVPVYILITFIYVLIGMVFGWIVNLIVRTIKKNGK